MYKITEKLTFFLLKTLTGVLVQKHWKELEKLYTLYYPIKSVTSENGKIYIIC